MARACKTTMKWRTFLHPGVATGALLALGVSAPACQSPDYTAGRPPPGKVHQAERFWARHRIRGVDLVFVVDNSPSMRAKLPLLNQGLVQAVGQLIRPDCVDDDGEPTSPPARVCPEGSHAVWERVDDLRVAVLSSSLGGHGSELCPRDVEGKDDRGHLIPTVRSSAPDPNGTGFLWYREDRDEDVAEFLTALQEQLEAVGSTGCEFEAPLEAWYRFLVDPAPPLRIVVNEAGQSDAERDANGSIFIDHELLAQRERFLRPQSLLAVLVVSDENDCSIMDGGVRYRGAGLGHRLLDVVRPLSQASALCADNPNDACCFSCEDAQDYPQCENSGCGADPSDNLLSTAEDPPELRCWDQMRRFGRDLLYPIERYVDALSSPRLIDARSGAAFDNPLLRGAGRRFGQNRPPGLVFFGLLGGLPWQDVAQDRTTLWNRWNTRLQPSDPSDASCPCSTQEGSPSRRAICTPEYSTDVSSSTQYSAQVSPTPRQLLVAKESGASAFVASLCPEERTVHSPAPPFAYANLFAPFGVRGTDSSGFRCDAPILSEDADGQVDCTVVEGVLPQRFDFPEERPAPFVCTLPGRQPLSVQKRELFLSALQEAGRCGPDTSHNCNDFLACELLQLRDDDLVACRNDGKKAELHPRPGYCYVDAGDYQFDQTDSLGGAANASPDFRAQLKNCPAAEQRTLRLVGSNTPWPHSVTYALCRKVELSDEAPM